MVGKSSAQVSIRELVESPGASGGAPPVNHDYDKSKFRHGLKTKHSGKILGDEESLRPGVHLLDDWILLRGIEVRGPPDQTIDVCAPIRGLPLERLGKLPSRLQKVAGIGLFENAHFRSVPGTPKNRLAGQIGPRVAVHKEPSVWRQADRVVCIFRR